MPSLKDSNGYKIITKWLATGVKELFLNLFSLILK
jgi:hypothetical protein